MDERLRERWREAERREQMKIEGSELFVFLHPTAKDDCVDDGQIWRHR